jgi:dienelactone hydrolase
MKIIFAFVVNVLFLINRVYTQNNDWLNYSRHRDEEIKKLYSTPEKVDTEWPVINNDAWNLFLNSDQHEVLEKALQWTELVLKYIDINKVPVAATVVDTKANILFKLGKDSEAIALEKQLIRFAEEEASKQKIPKEKSGIYNIANESLKQMQKDAQQQTVLFKPMVDTSAFTNWSSARMGTISNDGKYASFAIWEKVDGDKILVIKQLNGNWKKEFPGISSASFTDDSKRAVVMLENDSLALLTLGTEKINYINHVKSYRLFSKNKVEFLACSLDNGDSQLLIVNLNSSQYYYYNNVSEYELDPVGKSLFIHRNENHLGEIAKVIYQVSIPSGKEIKIWSGFFAETFIFDHSGNQCVFLAQLNKISDKQVFYYKTGMLESTQLSLNYNRVEFPHLLVDKIEKFSSDGDNLFVYLTRDSLVSIDNERPGAGVDIYNHKDSVLQSKQLIDLARFNRSTGKYYSSINIKDLSVKYLQNNNEEVAFLGKQSNAFIILYTRNNKVVKRSLLSVSSGEKKEVPMEIANSAVSLSPDNRYLILIDNELQNFYCYEIKSGNLRNITKDMPIALTDGERDWGTIKPRGISLVAWTHDNSSVIIYDKYDIWQIDIQGKKKPFCLTNGFGRKNNLLMRFCDSQSEKTIRIGQKYILTVFDLLTKDNGFYSQTLGVKSDPEKLLMDHALFFTEDTDPVHDLNIFRPLKARDAYMYIVEKQRADSSINYFYTTDFKVFQPLTQTYPEKKYNWITSELVNFTTLSGELCQGILYKPENFDSEKRYPIIFHYYQKMSHYLHVYRTPGAFWDNINIPYLVSQGYLVFATDINFKQGEPGRSAFNAVVGAAKKLISTYNWIDSTKMGLQGHSFGGFETNYIITHTNIFAAACSAAGVTDVTRGATDISDDGNTMFEFYESFQVRLKYPLWERPDIYIDNSPIYFVNRVETPLLMMHNMLDGAVPFVQSQSFFAALRRLHKKSWLLQYDSESHSVLNNKNKLDYAIRVNQFFNHYLKGMDAPVWMTRGIPASMKGIETGYALDPAGNCGKECKVCGK